MFNAYHENEYTPYFDRYEDAEGVDFFVQVSYEIMNNPRRNSLDRCEELARALVAFADSVSYDYMLANEELHNAVARFSNACDDVNEDDAETTRAALLDSYKAVDALLYELL